MSRSWKKHSGGTCCVCKSQKKGKTTSNRRFRRGERQSLRLGEEPPHKPRELTNQYDLGGDGKTYYNNTDDKTYRK